MDNKDNIEKEKQISKEYKKLKKMFKFLDKEKENLADKLCKKAAFMDVTLNDLQEKINEEGYIIEAVNGNGFKIRMDNPAAKGYNTMIKNFNQTIKHLIDLIPEESTESSDKLLEFVRKR
ncbi:MAG: hypothetical protein RSB99_03460 [Bacilli bacterium]|uniref:hypothetical protein n=1 Tax=Chryseobacterium sp. TaxID=1871047 RepID=UPI002FC8CB99